MLFLSLFDITPCLCKSNTGKLFKKMPALPYFKISCYSNTTIIYLFFFCLSDSIIIFNKCQLSGKLNFELMKVPQSQNISKYIQPCTTVVDWAKVGCLMEVSTMFTMFIFVDTVFLLGMVELYCMQFCQNIQVFQLCFKIYFKTLLFYQIIAKYRNCESFSLHSTQNVGLPL